MTGLCQLVKPTKPLNLVEFPNEVIDSGSQWYTSWPILRSQIFELHYLGETLRNFDHCANYKFPDEIIDSGS